MPEPTGYIPDKNASEWWNNAKKKVYDYGKFAEENYSPITKFLVPVDNLDNLVNSMNTQNNNPSFKGALEVMSQGLQTTPVSKSTIKHGWKAFGNAVQSKIFQRAAYESVDEKENGGYLPQPIKIVVKPYSQTKSEINKLEIGKALESQRELLKTGKERIMEKYKTLLNP